MIRRSLFVVAALLAVVCPSVAQEKPSIHAEIRLLAFDPAEKLEEAYIQDPAAPAGTPAVKSQLKSYLNHEFSAVDLMSRKVVITSKPERTSLTVPGEVLAEVTLPNDVNSAILLFLPGKAGGKAKFQVYIVNDSKRAFPAGSYFATNLSSLPIRLQLEQKVFEFKPGQPLLIQDPPVREGRKSGMRTFAFKDSAWGIVSTGIWPHPGDNRSLLVFFFDPASGDIQLRSFDDVPPREPEQPKTT